MKGILRAGSVLICAITALPRRENLVKIENPERRQQRKTGVALVTVGVYDDPAGGSHVHT